MTPDGQMDLFAWKRAGKPRLPREGNPMFDAVVALWFPDGPNRVNRELIGMLARDFLELGARTQGDLERRIAEFERIYAQAPPTAIAIRNRWAELGGRGVCPGRRDKKATVMPGIDPRNCEYGERDRYPLALQEEATELLHNRAWDWFLTLPADWRRKWEPWTATDAFYLYAIVVAPKTRLRDYEPFVRGMARILYHEYLRMAKDRAAVIREAVDELECETPEG